MIVYTYQFSEKFNTSNKETAENFKTSCNVHRRLSNDTVLTFMTGSRIGVTWLITVVAGKPFKGIRSRVKKSRYKEMEDWF